MVGQWWSVILTSAAPISELRGGIPLAMAGFHWPWWQAFVVAVLANWLSSVGWLGFLVVGADWARRKIKLIDKFLNWLYARTQAKHEKSFARWGSLALIIFIGIPLPMTGAWSGAVAAVIFGIPWRRALWLLLAGIVAAGVIVTLVTASAMGLVL